MQPEQFQIDINKYEGEEVSDLEVKPVMVCTKSDVWSLGVMASEMFSGVLPYYNINNNKKPTDFLIIKRLIERMPFPIPNNLDDDIKNVVQRATMINVDERASAKEIKEMIEKIIENKKLVINEI